MQVDRITGISKVTLLLLVGTVSSAALSLIFHTRIHDLSEIFLLFTSVFGFFALIKLINVIADCFPRPIEVPLHWIHAMTFEALALVSVLILRIFRFSKFFQKPAGYSNGRPILLVHGYCNDSSVWVYLRNRLAKENIGPVYTIDLGFPFRSIREYARKVKEKADQIRAETRRSDLILVGHSMGGLVSALYATDLAPPETVTDVVTIGAPLAGTHIAKIGVGPNAKEMQRSSDLIDQLNRKIAADHSIRFYHIATNTDQLVIPFQSALLGNNPSREFLFEDMGHASMLFSPRVGDLLLTWISN